MANGPLGGFMPTPPSPGQPPQVKLETSAESRGAFNKFLGTLPSNGAIAPIQTGVVPSSTAPVTPMTDNVNIFQPQMSQMAPMPMMPPAQPVQNFFMGGAAMSGGDFSDADIGSQIDSFDSGSNNDDNIDDSFPDSDMDYTDVFTDDELQQATDIGRQTGGDDGSQSVVDTRPRTNIRNVGPTSNLRFDPQFTADLLSRRFGDDNISGFMAPADFAQTTQGGATGQTSTVGLPSLGLGQNLLTAKPTVSRQDVLTAANRLSDIAPAASVPLAPTSPFFDRDLLDDPLGLGIRTGFGPVVDAIEAGRARARAFPSAGTPVAGLPTIVPGAGGTLPDADPLSTDVMKAIRSGAAGIPFTNNPGALKQGQENLTTEVIKTLPDEKLAPGQKLNIDFLAPAIFNTLEAGIGGIDRQLSLYADKPGANITTPAALANTYLGSGNKENTPRNRAAYIDAIKNVAGDKFDLNNPTTRDNISKAIANQEFGSAGAKVMDEIRGARTVLDNFNLDQLRLNEPLTSNVDQLATLDPIVQTQTTSQIPDVLPDISQEFRQRDPRTFAPFISGTTQIGPGGRFTFSETPGRFLGTLGGRTLSPDVYSEGSFDISDQKAPTLSSNLISAGSQFGRGSQVSSPPNIRPNLQEQVAKNILDGLQTQADTDAAALSLGIAPFTRQDTGVSDRVRGTGDAVENLLRAGRREELLKAGRIAQEQKNRAEIDSSGVTSTVTPDAFDDVIGGLNTTADVKKEIDQELSPIVAAGIGAPKEFREPFPDAGINIFGFRIPTLTSGFNALSNLSRQRVFDAVLNKGATPVYDGDVLVGAKINGVLVEGMDPNAPTDSGDSEDPIEKFLKKATEDKEEEEKDTTPNVIGGGTPRKTLENIPTVVSSPFQARDINFRPVGFDANNLNKIIERITGVPSPRRMQDGGTVSAVDKFLSKVA